MVLCQLELSFLQYTIGDFLRFTWIYMIRFQIGPVMYDSIILSRYLVCFIFRIGQK